MQSAGSLKATMLVLAAAAVAFEWLRLHNAGVRQRVGRLLPVFRAQEELHPSGAMWLALGYALASWIPMPAAAAGILAAALGDPAASWVGSRWGGGARKTWVGTLAMALVAGLAVAGAASVIGGAPVLRCAVVGGGIAAALERWNGPVDDNLLVPPGVALAIWLVA